MTSSDDSADGADAASSTAPRPCPVCGAAIAPNVHVQHEEWHRRVDDATWGGCPA